WGIAFVGNIGPVKTVDSGAAGAWLPAALADVALLALFGVQHSVMARGRFKRWLTRSVPQAAERSVYVLLSSVALALVFGLWQPIPGEIWNAGGAARTLLLVLFWLGWAMVFASSF